MGHPMCQCGNIMQAHATSGSCVLCGDCLGFRPATPEDGAEVERLRARYREIEHERIKALFGGAGDY